MRLKIAVAVVLASIGAAQAQVIEGSRAFTFPENDNQLIAMQKQGGDPGQETSSLSFTATKRSS